MSAINWIGVVMLVAWFIHGPMLLMGFRPAFRGEMEDGLGSPQFFRKVFLDVFLLCCGLVLFRMGLK